MSYSMERQFVLKMLETGTIDTTQACTLIDALQPALVRKLGRRRCAPDKVVLEIDTSGDNLQQVLTKLTQAVSQPVESFS